MAEYRVSVSIALLVDTNSLLNAQELVAEEISSLFGTDVRVEVKSSNIDCGDPEHDPPPFGAPDPVLADLNRRMVEALERVVPKKPEWQRDDDATGAQQ